MDLSSDLPLATSKARRLPRWTSACCTLLCLATLALGAQASARPLFRPAAEPPSAEQRLQLEADPYVMRWRMARMDSNEVFRAGPASAPLVLDLFDDVPMRAQVRSAKTLESGSSFLFGTIEGGGHFSLLRTSGGIVRGEFDSAYGLYRVEGSGTDSMLVKQQDRSKFPGCAVCGVGQGAMREPQAPLKARTLQAQSNAAIRQLSSRVKGSDIDIVAVYDETKLTGEFPAIKASIEHLFAYMNQVLENSGLAHRRVRLAAIEEVELYLASKLHIHGCTGYVPDDATGRRLLEMHSAELIHVFTDSDYILGAAGAASRPVTVPFAEHPLRINCKNSENYALCLRNERRRQEYDTYQYKAQVSLSTTLSVDVFAHEIGHMLGLLHGRVGASYPQYDPLYYVRFVRAKGETVRGRIVDYWPWPYGHVACVDGVSNKIGGIATVMWTSTTPGGRPVRQEILDLACSSYPWRLPYFSNPDLKFPSLSEWDSGFRLNSGAVMPAMGVAGDEETFDFNSPANAVSTIDRMRDAIAGPANAVRTIDRMWDAIAGKYDPPLDRLPGSCNVGDVPSSILSEHLPSSVALGPGPRRLSFAFSLSAPDDCRDDVSLRVRTPDFQSRTPIVRLEQGERLHTLLMAWPDAGRFDMGVAEPQAGAARHQLSISTDDHFGACSATKRAFAVVELTDEAVVDDAVAWANKERILQKVPGTRRHGMAIEQVSAHPFCRGAPVRQLRRLGDFNGDGKSDVLLRHADSRWLYYPMDGRNTLSDGAVSPNLTANPAVSVAGVGDFNGDGKDDLLVRRPNGGWRYYAMDGRRILPGGGGVALPTDWAWQVEGIGDFNRDGKDDVLMRRLDGEYTIFRRPAHFEEDWRYYAMDGRTVLGEGSPAGLSSEHPTETWVTGIGNFSGSGRDAALLRRIDGTWHYLPFHGGADGRTGLVFGHGPVDLPNDLAWVAAGIADFNGDGKDDVLLRHEDGRWHYQPMNGRELLGEGRVPDLPTDPRVWLAGVGDMNGDGRADVLTRQGHDAWHYWPSDVDGPGPNSDEVDLAAEAGWGVLAGGLLGAARVDAPMVDQLLATGEDATLDLSVYFSADQPLTYEAASGDADVVRVQVTSGGELMLTPVADGRAIVTITARDADGYAVRQTFQAIVSADGQVGRRFRDCPDCPEMVVVPAGSFMMGSPPEEEGGPQSDQRHERPQHRVDFAAPFAIGLFEVTFEQWDACLADGGCGGYRPETLVGFGEPNHPIEPVSWNDAQAYVEWLSARTGQTYRLPSDAEWEYATRAGTTTPFHFGETIRTDQANYDGEVPSPRRYGGEEASSYARANPGIYRHGPVRVGSLPANPWGLHEVHGNVSEWTQDCSDSVGYAGWPADGSALESGDCESRYLRNGSYYDDPGDVRSARRSVWPADFRAGFSGFRVAKTLGD